MLSYKMLSLSSPSGCLTDTGVISVKTSMYGRTDATTCAGGKTPEELADTSCSLQGADDIIKKRFLGCNPNI